MKGNVKEALSEGQGEVARGESPYQRAKVKGNVKGPYQRAKVKRQGGALIRGPRRKATGKGPIRMPRRRARGSALSAKLGANDMSPDEAQKVSQRFCVFGLAEAMNPAPYDTFKEQRVLRM